MAQNVCYALVQKKRQLLKKTVMNLSLKGHENLFSHLTKLQGN